jgi:Cu/Ag efflux pump CusA
MLQRLAIAVIGGLLSSLARSLDFTPAVHYFLRGRPAPRSSELYGFR